MSIFIENFFSKREIVVSYWMYLWTGGDSSTLKSIDGLDLWNTLTQDKSSLRTEFLVNIDPVDNSAGVRVGDWKLVYSK